MNDYKQTIAKIAESLNKDNKKISMSSIREFAKKNNLNINKINYGSVVDVVQKSGYDFDKSYDKEKICEKRIEMARLTHQGWTLQKIADKFGVTRQAVSLSLKKAAAVDNQIVVKSKRSRSDLNEKNVIFIRRAKKINNTCKNCGKVFSTEKQGKKTCSQECLNNLKVGGVWSRIEKIELQCSHCSSKFFRTKHLQKVTEKTKGNSLNNYCSRKCYHESRKNPVQG